MTKKKTLLKEGTVRQFMKLANLQPLASGFVDKLYEGDDGESKGDKGKGKHKDEKDYTDGGDRKGDESETHAGEDDEKEEKNENLTLEEQPVDAFTRGDKPDLEEQEDIEAGEELEMGAEEGPEGEEEEFEVEDEVEVEGGDVDVNALVRAIAAAIEAETGVSVDVAEEGGEGEEEVELGGEEEEGGEELDFGEEGEEELGGEELGGGEEDLEEIISTIAENVTNRLKKMTEAKKKVKK